MKRFRHDIIGISEVRWTGKCETPDADFIGPEEETVHMRDVSFLFSAHAKKALIGYQPIGPRIISARFDATPFKITVMHECAPNSATSKEDIEASYSYIEKEIGTENVEWKSCMGKYGHSDRNERLLEFATAHDLYICNTRFQQKPNRKWSWAPPDGTHKNMIDLILIQIQTGIRALKTNKSLGSHGIPAEMLQAGEEPLAREIYRLCNKAWHECAIPEEWGKSVLVSIPKKGYLSKCYNYRTVSLISHTGKYS
ncbi:unnamed protein product [Adineta ricciae]|nr:unnamed protein product [Adineta ricciae]